MAKTGALSRAIKVRGGVVPLPWSRLAEIVQPRPGDLVDVLGAPGVGKSTFGVQWAYHTASPPEPGTQDPGLRQGEPVLCISLDTDLRTQAVRVAALRLDKPTWQIEDEIKKDPAHWIKWFADPYLPPVRWSDVPMRANDLDELLEAEMEFLGQAPALVIVDVMGDVVEEESLEAYLNAFRSLHRIARKYKLVVCVLHHLKRGDAATGTIKFGLDEGLWGGERAVEIVLGMWQPNKQSVYIAVLKNRRGLADKNGDMSLSFPADLSKARIGR